MTVLPCAYLPSALHLLKHLVQDTHEGVKVQYSNPITKCVTQRAGRAVGNLDKDIRLSQDLQGSHCEHGPEVDPEGLWHEKNMGFSHRCEHQEALSPDLVPDFTPGDPGDLFSRAGTPTPSLPIGISFC